MSYKVFRLIIGLYWGLASYYFILFVLDFGIDSLYPQRSFDDVIGIRQLSSFLIAFTVGYFALPRFLNDQQGARRRAFMGGMLCFALTMFLINTVVILTSDYDKIQFFGQEPSDLLKVLFHLSGALISSAIVSPFGGLFALIALRVLPTPTTGPTPKINGPTSKQPDRDQPLSQSNQSKNQLS